MNANTFTLKINEDGDSGEAFGETFEGITPSAKAALISLTDVNGDIRPGAYEIDNEEEFSISSGGQLIYG